MTVTDGAEFMSATRHSENDSDESTVSLKLSECADLNGIGKMTKLDKVTLQVALKNNTEAQGFTFSRT